jgi:hypothetical protein
MLDLLEELRAIIAGLNRNNIEYALCDGMALGVHGLARTTIDIDLLIHPDSLEETLALAQKLGYNIRGKDLSLAEGNVEIRRASKIDPEDGELLSLDLLLVTPAVVTVWESRLRARWEDGELSVVSVPGLIALKQLRGSDQDLVDIKWLKERVSDDAG